MQSNELRIGNWVTWKNHDDYSEYQKIDGKDIEHMQYCELHPDDPEERIRHYSDYYPIPLTEEMLLKFGFIWADDNVYGGFISPMLEDGSRLRIRHNSKGYFYTSNEYVQPLYIISFHQLQNLFYALTNKELQITF